MSVWSRPLDHDEFALGKVFDFFKNQFLNYERIYNIFNLKNLQAVVSWRTDGISQEISFNIKEAGLKPLASGKYLCADLYDPNHPTFDATNDQKLR